MMLTVDRNDPEFVRAAETAARVAEFLLDCHNGDAKQELALDVLADWVSGIDVHLIGGYKSGLRDPRKRLAWALVLTERRTDLKPHEQRLLDDAWALVRELELQRHWEEMGL